MQSLCKYVKITSIRHSRKSSYQLNLHAMAEDCRRLIFSNKLHERSSTNKCQSLIVTWMKGRYKYSSYNLISMFYRSRYQSFLIDCILCLMLKRTHISIATHMVHQRKETILHKIKIPWRQICICNCIKGTELLVIHHGSVLELFRDYRIW